MSAGARAVWAAYRGAVTVASPLAPAYLARRARAGREDEKRYAQKLGRPGAVAFAERPVWLHAVSVGEAVSLTPLAERFAHAGVPVVMTSGTVAGAKRIEAEAARLAPFVVHQYAPLDVPRFVVRFLSHWQPRAAIFAESEIWPATLHALGRRGILKIHANARISERSARRWAQTGPVGRALFSSLDLVLAQSARQASHFRALGAPRVETTGNMKFDAPAPTADLGKLAALREAAGERPVFLAASTHDGEEALVAGAHMRLAADFDGLITVIAPRHPQRAAAIADMLCSRGLSPTWHSKGELPRPGVHLADAFGELGTLFAFADVTLLGGSLVPLGGHNPAEPAHHGAALLTGPSHGEMFAPFVSAGAARVIDGPGLADAVTDLLTDRPAREAMGRAAQRVLSEERGAAERTFAALTAFAPSLLATEWG